MCELGSAKWARYAALVWGSVMYWDKLAVLQKSYISCRCSCELTCNFLGTTYWGFSWIWLITPIEFSNFIVCCDLLLGVPRLFHLCPWFCLFIFFLKSITRHSIFSPWICCLDQRFQFGEQKELCWCLVDTRLFLVLSDTFFYMLAYDGKILSSMTPWLLPVLNFSFGFYCSCQSCPTD